MSGRQMSQTAKYQGAKCLGREMSLPPIVWGTYCPGSQISGRQMSQRQLSGADRRAPNVRQPFVTHLCRPYLDISFLSLLPGSAEGGWKRQRCVTLTLPHKLFFFKGLMRVIRKIEMRELNF